MCPTHNDYCNFCFLFAALQFLARIRTQSQEDVFDMCPTHTYYYTLFLWEESTIYFSFHCDHSLHQSDVDCQAERLMGVWVALQDPCPYAVSNLVHTHSVMIAWVFLVYTRPAVLIHDTMCFNRVHICLVCLVIVESQFAAIQLINPVPFKLLSLYMF